jgi:Arc/MetJ-type ribon-helix-helix transcriptional regulator
MTRIRKRNGGRKPAPAGSTRLKIAISLPSEQVAAAQKAVDEGRVPSVSAFVARALERQADADCLGELVAQMRAEDGEPSAADYAWADEVLSLSRKSEKRATRGTPTR